MSKKSSSKTNFLAQGTILVIASFVAKAIGMIYRIPLTHILGDDGNGYYSTANEIYTIILMISSFSLPLAVSRLVAEREYAGEVKNSYKVLICSLRFAAVTGGILSILTFLLGGVITKYVMGVELASYALRVLAPAIFLFALTGVLRGFFQVHGTMVPTAVSQIIEQIFVATFALLMSHVFIQHFSATGDMDLVHRWGAAGATMGTGAGVASALIFMLIVYGVNRKIIRKRIVNDRHSINESMGHVMSNIVLIIMPIILSAFIYNVNGYINSYMYSGIMDIKGAAKDVIQTLYSEYGYYMTLINIPLTLASTAPTSMIPEVSAHYAMHDIEGANMKTDRATWISMLISIPAAVGLAVLSGPITRLIFPGTNGVGGQLLILGGITIILNGNSNITNGVLQGIGKPKLPMIHAAIALVADVIAMALLLVFTNLGVYTIVIAQIVYAVVMCLLNDRSIKKYMGYKNPWRSAYLSPFLASIPMGVVAGVVYYGLYALIHSNVICLGISVMLAAGVYFIVYLFVSKPGEDELGMMPGGRYMKKLARMMKII